MLCSMDTFVVAAIAVMVVGLVFNVVALRANPDRGPEERKAFAIPMMLASACYLAGASYLGIAILI